MPDPEFLVQRLESEHWVRSTTGDGHLNYLMTGIVVLTPIQGSGGDWKRLRMSFPVPIRLLQPGQSLSLIHWAPLVTLSSIANNNEAVNAGWAVDGFGIANPGEKQHSAVEVFCDLAVRDVDGFIARLGYMVNLLGDEVPA
jgi:hypothetical protein